MTQDPFAEYIGAAYGASAIILIFIAIRSYTRLIAARKRLQQLQNAGLNDEA